VIWFWAATKAFLLCSVVARVALCFFKGDGWFVVGVDVEADDEDAGTGTDTNVATDGDKSVGSVVVLLGVGWDDDGELSIDDDAEPL